MELRQATTLNQVLGRFRSALDIDAVREGEEEAMKSTELLRTGF